MRARRSLLSLMLVLAIWAGSAASAAAEQPSDPVATMARIVRDLDLQTKMPKEAEPRIRDLPWSGLRWHIPGNVAEWILWGALAAGAGFALYAFRDSLPLLSRRRKVRPRAAAIVLPNDETIARLTEAGEDADDLARRGLLAEAMHLLLLRGLAEMRRRLQVTIADSLTSREILARLALPDVARTPLADLVGRVELVHFGSRVPEPTDYRACRSSFDALVASMRSPSAAVG